MNENYICTSFKQVSVGLSKMTINIYQTQIDEVMKIDTFRYNFWCFVNEV